ESGGLLAAGSVARPRGGLSGVEAIVRWAGMGTGDLGQWRQREDVLAETYPTAVRIPQSTWEPPTQPIALAPPPGRRNRAAGVIGALTVALATVLSVALVGRIDTQVDGVARAAGQTSGETPVSTVTTTPTSSQAPEPRPVYQLGTNPLLAEGVELPQVSCDL